MLERLTEVQLPNSLLSANQTNILQELSRRTVAMMGIYIRTTVRATMRLFNRPSPEVQLTGLKRPDTTPCMVLYPIPHLGNVLRTT